MYILCHMISGHHVIQFTLLHYTIVAQLELTQNKLHLTQEKLHGLEGICVSIMYV